MTLLRTKESMTTKLKAKKGRPFKERPARQDLKKLYVKEGRSGREIAGILGCSKDLIYRALREYEIEVRASARRSILLQYRLPDLKAAVKEKGVRGYARELGINPSTLLHHLKGRKVK